MAKKQTLVDLWMGRLLDLGRRNRMIHYRPTKRRALAITEPEPSSLYDRITTSEKGLTFCRPIDKKSAPRTYALLSLLSMLDHPVDVKIGDINYAGDAQAAEKALAHMRAQYKLAHEEQGCHILYLSFGFLEWRDGKGGSKGSPFVRSPLILVPVDLFQETPSSPFLLKRRDDDIVLNPGLQLVFERQGILLPPFDETADTLEGYLAKLEAPADEHGWKLFCEASLGLLSFQKISMYRDIEKNRERVEENAFVRALSGKEGGFFRLPTLRHDSIPYADTLRVLPADSSQEEAIEAAKRGESFVMEGPPGTGKSQTITNIIAEFIKNGKKVLFVSGKNAALQVVYRRLRETGLSAFCLPLHDHRANKRRIVNEIADTLTQKAKELGEQEKRDLMALEEKRHELNAYAEALYRPIAPLGLTAYACQSALVEQPSCPRLPLKRLPQSEDEFLTLLSLAARYDREREAYLSRYPVLPKACYRIRPLTPPELIRLKNALTVLEAVQNTLSVFSDKGISLDFLQIESLSAFEKLLFLSEALPPAALAEIRRSGGEVLLREGTAYYDDIKALSLDKAELQAAFSSAIAAFSCDRWYIEMSAALRETLSDKVISLFIRGGTPDQLLDRRKTLSELLDRLIQHNNAVDEAAASLGRVLNLPISRSYRELYRYVAYLPMLSDQTLVAPIWYDTAPDPDPKLFKTCRKNAENAIAIEEKIMTVWRPDVFELNYKFLRDRFSETVNGLFAFLAHSSKNEVRRTLTTYTKNGECPTDDEIHTLFDDLASLSLAKKRFLHYEKSLGALCGSCYHGIHTDLVGLERGLSFLSSLPPSLKAVPGVIRALTELPQSEKKQEAFRVLGELDAALNTLAALAKAVKGFGQTMQDVSLAALSLNKAKTRVSAVITLYDTLSNYTKRPLGFEEIGLLFNKMTLCRQKEAALAKSRPRLLQNADIRTAEAFLTALSNESRRYCDPMTVHSLLKEALSLSDHDRRALRQTLSEIENEAEHALALLKDAFYDRDDSRLTVNEASAVAKALLSEYESAEAFMPMAEVLFALFERGFSWLGEAYEALSSNAACEDVLRLSVYEAHLTLAKEESDSLRRFMRQKQDKLQKSFAALDQKRLTISRHKIVKTLLDTLPQSDREYKGEDELSILEHERQKRRGYLPLRKLFAKIPNLLLTLKPCFMMSPLSVSYFLEKESYQFDLVIFDEASQLFPEDAVGAIMRGKQVIVVGDSKQLPPTDFFSSRAEGYEEDEEEEDIPDETPTSILEAASAVLPKHSLLWHYRSRYESLIAFSNHKIYHGDLITFPSPRRSEADSGIDYIYLPDGIYEPGKGQNLREAQEAVALLQEHILRHPERSLGMIAFGKKQQRALEEAVTAFRMEHPEYDDFFGEGRDEPFFIKNLENVQGDERDTVIFSIGYGKTEKGRFLMNFGPLSKLGGERRLNVAITRAKYHIQLIGSVLPSDFNLAATESEGVHLLRAYIDYACNKEEALCVKEEGRLGEQDGFVKTVSAFLNEHGYRTELFFGTSRCRVDIAVFHPELKGAVAALETDGESYHLAKTASDREHLRPSILTGMGWRVYRLYSAAWLASFEKEAEKLLAFLEKGREEESDFESTPILQASVGVADYTDSADPADSADPSDPAETPAEEGLREVPDRSDLDGREDCRMPKQDKIPYGFSYYRIADYTRAPITDLHDKEATVAERMRYVIETEGPIRKDLLFSRLVPSFRVGRLTESVKQALQHALDRLLGDGVITDDADFVMLKGQAVTVRLPKAGEEIRPFDCIAKEELAKAMQTVLADTVGALPDDLYHEILRLFGFERMTPKYRAHCENALFLLLMKEKVRLSDSKIQVIS